MNTSPNKNAAIYCVNKHDKLLKYINKNYDLCLSLYDEIDSQILYDLPRFHYTEINNAGYIIYIDDLRLFDRLKNKNNTVIYYMANTPNHNMNYTKLFNLIQNIDGVLLENTKIDKDLMLVVFQYTKELFYV